MNDKLIKNREYKILINRYYKYNVVYINVMGGRGIDGMGGYVR